MAQLRSVNTKFWEDPWIETLNVSEKLLFLYLITNSYANLAGIYEISIKRICFETGIDNKIVSNALERFGKVRKAYFVNDNFILLPNWLKNQNLNTNMKKNVVKIIQELPNDVKISVLGNDYQTIQKDYQTIRNTLLKYEDEVLEDEKEIEDETIKPKYEYLDEREILNKVSHLFDKKYYKTQKQKDNWLDEIRKLIQIDEYDKQTIIDVITFARKDEFWNSNLLSISSIRKKNKSNDATKFDQIKAKMPKQQSKQKSYGKYKIARFDQIVTALRDEYLAKQKIDSGEIYIMDGAECKRIRTDNQGKFIYGSNAEKIRL